MRVGFDQRYKAKNPWEVDSFDLKQDEKARICCIDEYVEMAMLHWVSIPNDKRSGQYFCLGDHDVIFGDGDRPGQGHHEEKCPFCRHQIKLANKAPGVGLVSKKFGTNIIRYVTNAKGELRPGSQITADCLPWLFNSQKYNRLADIAIQYGDPQYGLRTLDLDVTCTNEGFKTWQIDTLRDCWWRKGGDLIAQQIFATFQKDRIGSFAEILGRKVSEAEAENLAKAAMGISSVAMGGMAPMNSPADMQKLLDESVPRPEQAKPNGPIPFPVQQVTSQHGPIAPPPQQQNPFPTPAVQGQGVSIPPPWEQPKPQQGPAPQMPTTARFEDLLKGKPK